MWRITLKGSISIDSYDWVNPHCQDALIWASTKYKLNPWKELPMHQALELCDNTNALQYRSVQSI